MEMVPVMPVLLIAAVFFLVTMALAIGPLLVYRLFLSAPQEHDPKRGSAAPILTALMTVGAVMGGVAFLYVLQARESQETATVFAEVAAARDTERSLFASDSVAIQQMRVPDGREFGLSWAAILLPLLIVCSLLGLAGNWSRGGLSRLVPVAVVLAATLGLLIVWNVSAQNHRTHVVHEPEMQWFEQETLATHRRAIIEDQSTSRSGAEDSTVNEDAPEADATATSPAIIEYVSTNAEGVPRETPPDWMTKPESEGPIRVIESGLHATVELAERNALAQLKSMMLSDFVKEQPDARGWQPSDEVILQSGSVLHRAIEKSQITVGEFTNPMYEAYWQVDTSADASLYQTWRPEEVQSRLAWLGGGIGLLTLLFGSLAALLHIDEQTGGKRRKALTFGTVALWAAAGGAVLLLA